ncbi:PaaI family thioesterase [Variovorax paradoxus]|uniref:PaaI family thioesterase n=1 Tax=Variovorax paradoxus TaxID=34073 RepID=UPI0019344F0C|nr:PaaI family thioesterase [Variovorax paradoxus]
MDNDAYFWKIQRGELPYPRAVQTLGGRIVAIDGEKGVAETKFDGSPDFTNPAGMIQGGFISAMLDDTLSPALASMLNAGEFASTVSLSVNFFRAAKIGTIFGHGRVIRRGGKICHLAGELLQDGHIVATATAVAVIRELNQF